MGVPLVPEKGIMRILSRIFTDTDQIAHAAKKNVAILFMIW